MAVASIWAMSGRVDQVIEYARNPEKTRDSEIAASMHKVNNAIQYTTDELKTEAGELVSYINCLPDHVVAQFMETKRRYRKTTGRACYHGYQSFKKGEVTAEKAHEIGVALAKELWGDRFEVVVATHCNTGTYHNHFVLNSVSCKDGLKFCNSPADRDRMRDVSDRLCWEAGLSVIKNPGKKKKHYAEWKAEQEGKPTYRGTIRSDIDRAILGSVTRQQFMEIMTEMGYEFKIYGKSGRPLAQPSLIPPGTDSHFRFSGLGKGYTLDEIADRIYRNQCRKNPFPDAARKQRSTTPIYPMKGSFRAVPKICGLRAIYFRYCYELHILRKAPTSVKRVSFLLRQDLIKLDSYIAQAKLLGREKIETQGQLTQYKKSVESEIDQLTQRRSELRNELKRVNRQENESRAAAVKARISDISAKLKKLRKEVVLCSKIEERSGCVLENLEQLKHQQETERKESIYHEHIRRGSRSGGQARSERR